MTDFFSLPRVSPVSTFAASDGTRYYSWEVWDRQTGKLYAVTSPTPPPDWAAKVMRGRMYGKSRRGSRLYRGSVPPAGQR